MDEDSRREFEAQGAQLLATELIVNALLAALKRSGVLDDAALIGLFEEVQDALTASAYQLGAQSPPEYITRAMKIVEEIRSQLGLAKA